MLRFSRDPGSKDGEEGGGEGHVGEVDQTTYTFMNKCITIKTFSI
jgi:hypothetical protein